MSKANVLTDQQLMLAEPATLTPREIDTQLAALYERITRAHLTMDHAVSELKRAERANAAHPAPIMLQRAAEAVDAARVALRTVAALATPFEAEYKRRGWRRYFLVTNGNGHVHRGRSCVTCFPTTRYGWLPELSGCEERVMVAEYGEQACSVCFPDAPSLYAQLKAQGLVMSKRSAEAQAKRDTRAARRAELEAKRVANGITMPDGSPLVLCSRGGRITGWREAKRELVHITECLVHYAQRNGWDAERVAENRIAGQRLIAALAHKFGVTEAEVQAEAAAKVAKDHKAWGRPCGCVTHIPGLVEPAPARRS